MESSLKNNIIVADTNIAYILYFFLEIGLFSADEIKLATGEKIYFHPIVLEEFNAHSDAWGRAMGLGFKNKPYPEFFDTIKEDGISKLSSFITSNLSVSISVVDTNSTSFSNKRKGYESERNRLQQEWKKTGVKGKKVVSQPSSKDYSVLYTAEVNKYKIATNDEILFSISQEFLDKADVFRAEDIVRELSNGHDEHMEKIEEIASNIAYLKLPFVMARVFKK